MEDGVEIQKKIERVFGPPPKPQILEPTAVMSLKSDAEIVTLYVLGDHQSYNCDELPYILKVTEQYYEQEIKGSGNIPYEALIRMETLAPITHTQLDALLALIDSSHKEKVAQILASTGEVVRVEDSDAEDDEEEDSEAEDGEAEDEKK